MIGEPAPQPASRSLIHHVRAEILERKFRMRWLSLRAIGASFPEKSEECVDRYTKGPKGWYVLTEKLHITYSKSRSPSSFKRTIPTKIQSILYRQYGVEISYARLVVVFDRTRHLLDRHLASFLEAHHSGMLAALETHIVRIALVLYQQPFGRVVLDLYWAEQFQYVHIQSVSNTL